jgi:ParB-like chromosome segregation protein Spo0J
VDKSENEPTRPRGEHAGRFDELRDWESELFDQGAWSSAEEATDRDGLPAHYKMKHDAHYVDELFSANHARQVIQVRLADIAASSDEDWDPSRLAESLSEFGVLQPLLIRRNRGRYEVIAGAKRLAAARAAGLVEVPCLLYDADDEQVRRMRQATNIRYDDALESSNERMLMKAVFPLLGQSLHTIRTSLQSLKTPLSAKPHSSMTDDTSAQRERVASDLIRAEAQRAAFLAWSATLITFAPRLNLSRFDAADVLEEVLSGCQEDELLSGVRLDKRIQSRCLLEADRRLVSLALRGAVDAMLPMARSRQPSTMAVGLARHEPSGSIVLQLSQDALRPAEGVWHRWFDLSWRDRPGGIAAGVGLLAAKRVVDFHAGRLAVLPRQGGGCRLALSFPESHLNL